MKKTMGIITLVIAGLLMLNVSLISAENHPTATVSGTVTDATTDLPIEGAVVKVDGSDTVLPATTDVDGKYVLVDVPAGDQIFNASAVGYESESVGPEGLDAEETPVNFSLNPLDTVRGAVTDATNDVPIEGAVVKVDGSDTVLPATADDVGNYVLENVTPETQSFTASANGYKSETVGAEVSEAGWAIVSFTLQPLDDEQEGDDEDGYVEGGNAVTLRGYDGANTSPTTGSVPRRGFVGLFTFVPATSPATGAATEAFFTVTRKRGEVIDIQIPEVGLDSITKRPSRGPGIPENGEQVAVLVAVVDDEPTYEALKIIVKPPKPLTNLTGTVVNITTDKNGYRTFSIMGKNGKVKELQLGPEAELPAVGDVVTVFQGRGRGANGAGANGPPIATGIVGAKAVRQRLEGFLEDLTSEDGELLPQAMERRAKRVADIAARLENHATKHVELIQRARRNGNLPPRAVAGIQNGLETAESGLVDAKAKGAEAKTKAGPPSGKGLSQGGRGKKK